MYFLIGVVSQILGGMDWNMDKTEKKTNFMVIRPLGIPFPGIIQF